jgi:dihydrofolate synthase / folylpolyglutamate synthase
MTPRERLFALEQFGIKLGLDNILRILDALGHPEKRFQSVHVAGTNGKGSVTAMVERGLRSAGHGTGRYTSPHLNDIEERIAINGRAIDAAAFDATAAEVLSVVDRLRDQGGLESWPTFFEVTTAMAFLTFARERVDAAVVEVGLGGRFDATNTLTPAVSVITSIALDHERHLGSTIEAIAFEKAGIIKPNTPLVVGAMADSARSVILARATQLSAPVVAADSDVLVTSRTEAGRLTLDLRTPVGRYQDVTLALNGRHQLANAVVAVRTLEVCRERGLANAAADVRSGLAHVEWPARLEWLEVNPGRHVLVDAAHNPAGALALADYVRAAGVAPLPVVLAVMKDKDVAAMVRAIAPVTSVFVTTQVESPRCMPAAVLAQRVAHAAPEARVMSEPDPASALDSALRESPLAVVAGSIFLVGPLRAKLIARGAATTEPPVRPCG